MRLCRGAAAVRAVRGQCPVLPPVRDRVQPVCAVAPFPAARVAHLPGADATLAGLCPGRQGRVPCAPGVFEVRPGPPGQDPAGGPGPAGTPAAAARRGVVLPASRSFHPPDSRGWSAPPCLPGLRRLMSLVRTESNARMRQRGGHKGNPSPSAVE